LPRRHAGGAVLTFHEADLHLARCCDRRQLVDGRERRAAHPVSSQGRQQGAVALRLLCEASWTSHEQSNEVPRAVRGVADDRGGSSPAPTRRRRSRAIVMPFNYGWVVLFAGFCMHLCIGTVYCWGNMTTYATSYLRLTDPNLTYGDTLWVFMSGGLLQAVSMFPGGRLQLRIGQRLTALLGSTLVVGAYLFGSLATTLAPFLLCYGALFGLGTGLVYTCPTTAAVQWLPHRKGLVNGVVVMGFGLGAFCFNFFITAWCNPDHLPEDVVGPDGGRYYSEHSGVPGRVPGLLRTMAAAFAVVLALGSLLIRPPP
jgi:hypothetical protein